jgi:predicted 3-demethylubiquinone-9 3-methyltransferase (glyoxalase superfamily)
MTTITPCLWFDGCAEEAVAFYAAVFPDTEVIDVMKAPVDNPSTKAGEVLAVNFVMLGRKYTALNGGPAFRFNEAVSFQIECDGQAEVDRLWEALLADGGQPSMCGWLKDRFGLSWQVNPIQMDAFINGPDAAGAQRAMRAMMEMVKLDVEQMRRAYEGLDA